MAMTITNTNQRTAAIHATTITTMVIVKYNVRISNNNNKTMSNAHNCNIILDAIPFQLDPSTTRMWGQWREQGKDVVLEMVLIEDVVLAMVLIEGSRVDIVGDRATIT